MFGDEIKWLRMTLSPLLHALVKDSTQTAQVHRLDVVFPVSVLTRILPQGNLELLKDYLFSPSLLRLEKLKVTMYLSAPLQHEQQQIFAFHNGGQPVFVVVEVVIDVGQVEGGDDEEYALSLAAQLRDCEEPMSLDALEQQCPPPVNARTNPHTYRTPHTHVHAQERKTPTSSIGRLECSRYRGGAALDVSPEQKRGGWAGSGSGE